jgi:hypothetical protein
VRVISLINGWKLCRFEASFDVFQSFFKSQALLTNGIVFVVTFFLEVSISTVTK